MKIYISILLLSITIFSCKSPDIVSPTTSIPTTPTTTVTPPIIKSVTTNTVNIKLNSVVLNGEVSDEGGSPVTDRGFYWSETNTIPTDKDNKVQVGSGKGTYSYTLEGLKINTKYYYKSYSTNSKGTSTSDVQTVKTKTFEFKVVSDFTFGSVGIDYINYIQKSSDGNYIFTDGDIEGGGAPGNSPMGVVKIDKSGNQIFRNEFNPKPQLIFKPILYQFIQNSNGFYLNGSNSDGPFLRLIENNNVVWEKKNSFTGNCLVKGNDGGIIQSGNLRTNGYTDIFVGKFDDNGKEIWSKTFGGDIQDINRKLIVLKDGYLICGNTYSGNSGNKTTTNKGNSDIWVIKIDNNGNKVWEKDLGGNNSEFLNSVLIEDDGSIIIVGNSFSGISGDKSQPTLGYWILKLNSNGEKIWDKSYGDLRGGFNSKGIIKTPNNDYIIFGESDYSMKSGDKTEDSYGIDFNDIWLVCIDKNGLKLWDKIIGGKYEDKVVDIFYDNQSKIYQLIGLSSSPISFDKKTSEISTGKIRDDYWIVNFSYEIKD